MPSGGFPEGRVDRIYTKSARDEPGRVTSHPTIPTLRVVPSSTRHNSTTIDPIQEAIEHIESREAEDSFLYRQVSKIFGVDRTTLSRRHKGLQVSYKAKCANQQQLNPQQEDEVVGYIERATRDGLPPTQGILKNFGSAVAQQEVSDSWVNWFRYRHPDELTTK